MSIKEGQDIRITNTTRFLLRGLNLFKEELMKYGFVNAFLDDVSHEHHYENSVYLLFKPEDLSAFEWLVESEKLRTHLLVDEYDYPGGYIVLVYKFPAEFMDEYRLFLDGKYSKFREKYISLFPMEKKVPNKRGIPVAQPSFYHHVFKRTDTMREYWENKLDATLTEDSEYWSIPSVEQETLNIKNYE